MHALLTFFISWAHTEPVTGDPGTQDMNLSVLSVHGRIVHRTTLLTFLSSTVTQLSWLPQPGFHVLYA